MKYYPVLLDINTKPCLVVGAGPVGVRKAKQLARCGARVTVISKAFSETQNPDLDEFNGSGSIECLDKGYEREDVQGMALVFAATNDAQLNQAIRDDAGNENILCNVADATDSSDFILPSVVERGDLILAISTSGASPALARKLRLDLEKQVGPEYETILKVMGRIRKRLLAKGHAPEEHKKIFYSLIESGLLELIKAQDTKAIDSVLTELLGNGYNYQDLVSNKES